MKETCFACGNTLGFFETPNVIKDGKHGVCANCWGRIREPIIRFKYLSEEKASYDEVSSGYKDALRSVSTAGFKDDVKVAFIEEIDDIFEEYKKDFNDTQEEIEVEEEKQRAMASMLITSGFTFDGYKIVKYSGYISGDDAVQVDRGTAFLGMGTADAGQGLTDSLVKIRRQALKELKEAAYDLGCNAVIGVDFDYITLEPETASISGKTTYLPYVFCVTANGNAVIIEKDDSDRSLVSTMKEYKELLDAGIITQEEYERKRAQILDL